MEANSIASITMPDNQSSTASSHRRAPRRRASLRRTVFRFIGAVILGIAVVLAHIWLSALRGPASAEPAPRLALTSVTQSTPPPRSAQSAITALTGPDHRDTLAVLPSHFAAVMGYTPLMVNGYPINPHGDCSSPIPLPEHFEIFCKSHDFGYDLLRYANRTGESLSAGSREAIDATLIERMRESCTDVSCVAAAELSRAGLAANTWRQQGGNPTANESHLMITATTITRIASGFIGLPGSLR